MKYAWKRSIGGIKAQVAGEEIESIIAKKGGQIVPADVVAVAKNKNNPLHSCFEWDNDKAADAYRIVQAGDLIRCLISVQEQDNKEPLMVRAFVSIKSDDDLPVFTTISNAAENDEDWEYVIEAAWNELQAWKRKYKNLKQFESVFVAMETVEV